MPIVTKTNPFRSADTYKNEHQNMMPPDFLRGEAYIEARSGRKLDRVRFFGLNVIVKRILMSTWTPEDYYEANSLFTKAGAPLHKSMLEMAEIHGRFGRLPIEVWALPEGVVVPTGTPLVKIRAMDRQWGEFANWLESQMRIWGSTTVCTGSYEQREDLRAYYERSGAPMEALQFGLHDFGMRSTLCEQESALAGAAHLVNFRGSDNAEAMGLIKDFYGEDDWAKTVYADEHNVTITWGKNRRKEYLEFICNKYGTVPNTKFSHVMDTYNQDEEFDLVCGEMKPMIDATFGTTPGCTFITRPDSGKPHVNVVQYGNQLINAFGNASHMPYRRTPDYIGSIQGDGVDRSEQHSCSFALELAGIRADQWPFGSGSGLIRKHNRDDGGFAQKQNRALYENEGHEGEWRGTQKVPLSDPSKASKAGDLSVWLDDNGFWQNGTSDQRPVDFRDQMDLVYAYGKQYIDPSIHEVASRA